MSNEPFESAPAAMETDQAGQALRTPALRWLTPPSFPDEDRTRVGRILHTVLLILISGTLLAYLALLTDPNPLNSAAGISLMLVAELTAFFLLRNRRERAAALVLTTGLWLALAVIVLVSEGIANAAFFGMVIVVVIAGLTMGGQAGLIFASLSAITSLGVLAAKTNGLLPVALIPFQPFSFWLLTSVIFLAIAGLIRLATKSLQEAVERARRNEKAQAQAVRELLATRSTLEEQVRVRTQELQQRSAYLQTAVDVSRATASILDTDQLMAEAVELIASQFRLYYTGLFILDNNQEWAVLRAASGSAGKALLARGHRIAFGAGMIGWSIANAQARIAADIGQDAVRLATPELPDTRSEAAFPLRSRGKVLGAMSVQSVKPNAFGEMEISIFQALADQIAIALENTRLFNQSLLALQEAQRAYRQISNEAWEQYLHSGIDLTYRFDEGRFSSFTHPSATQEAVKPADGIPAELAPRLGAGRENSGRAEKRRTGELSLPISVRDQVIGTVRLQKQKTGERWTEDEKALLATIIGQLGIALDSARLYEETRRRAERERLTGEIIAKMRASNDPRTILQTATLELRKALQVDQAQLLVNIPELAGFTASERRAGEERQEQAEERQK